MFPDELIAYPQWICWKYSLTDDGKQTKLPFVPTTGKLASVTTPINWNRFDVAYASWQRGFYGFNGIGFVLTENDPFCGIDLDDAEGNPQIIQRQMAIASAMDSYSEVSPSGSGLHIWAKARVQQGRKRDKVEVYSSGRYLTVTGNTYINKPISDRQYLVTQLWNELEGKANHVDLSQANQPEHFSDEQIYNTARYADNGEKFDRLWRGEWQTMYQSQSEADFALINILGFYSRNIEQIRRMFRLSALGKRDKAKRHSYLDSMIRDSFDNSVPPIPIEELKMSVANQLAKLDAMKDQAELNPFSGPLFATVPDPDYDWTVPPGLLGEIAQFIYEASPRPVKEISLAAAIALMAGICGRAYNVSATGLNHYVLILANTGIGKEAASSGIDRLMQAVKKTVPASLDFIGPADIASGQALLKYLQKHPCFVSIVGEFGIVLKDMSSEHSAKANDSLRRALLSLYMKSGKNEIQRALIYSDADKNTDIIKSPSFSLLGESTPGTFYESMTETAIKQGLMPRFTVIQYEGKRPDLNEKHFTHFPSDQLIIRIGELCANSLVMAQHQRTIDVTFDPEAQVIERELDKKYTAKINVSELDVARELWNRAHLKILKLAALVAIGNNATFPKIDVPAIQWATTLIERDITNVIDKFDKGMAGRPTGETNQLREVCRIISEYLKRPYNGLEKYQVSKLMHEDRVLTSTYIMRRLGNNAAFNHDRLGPTLAVKRCVETLCNEGAMRELRVHDINSRYGKVMKAFMVMDLERFM